MQIKATMRHHLTPVTIAIKKKKKNLQTINPGEGTEKRETSYTVDGNVNWYSHYQGSYGGSLKKEKQNYHMT